MHTSSNSISITYLIITLLKVSCSNAQQLPPAQPQLNTFNPLINAGPEPNVASILEPAAFNNASVQAVQTAIDFERTNWAGSSVFADPFYQLPPNSSTASTAGSILKVEQVTNTSLYTVSPNLALSRFLYTTLDINGTVVPASAYVLWPWMPKFMDTDGIPVIAWAHGTSGILPECAPSHYQNLLYHYDAPFTAALQGYAVIAPDFAGLGVNQTSDGQAVPHQYGANPAAAYDLLFAVEAAQQAWPGELSKYFVAMGHSQGGGTAWSLAQELVDMPNAGYLGSIAASPLTDYAQFVNDPTVPPQQYQLLFSWIASSLGSIFRDFDLSDWLNPMGIERLNFLEALNGCTSVGTELWGDFGIVLQSNWTQSWFFDAFNRLASNGGKPVAGPLLVLQGTADPLIPKTITDYAVNETCQLYPDSSLTYLTFEGSGHVPVMYAAQQIWLQWIEDRFKGLPVQPGCLAQLYQPALPVQDYQKQINSFLELADFPYETGS